MRMEGATTEIHLTQPRQTPGLCNGGRGVVRGNRRRRRNGVAGTEATRGGDDGDSIAPSGETPPWHRLPLPAARGRETRTDARSERSLAASRYSVDQSEPVAHKHGCRLEAIPSLHPHDGTHNAEHAVSDSVRRTASHCQYAASQIGFSCPNAAHKYHFAKELVGIQS